MLSEFGDICHIYFREIGYFFKLVKRIWDTGTPPSKASVLDDKNATFPSCNESIFREFVLYCLLSVTITVKIGVDFV